jgi:hypothetical protein
MYKYSKLRKKMRNYVKPNRRKVQEISQRNVANCAYYVVIVVVWVGIPCTAIIFQIKSICKFPDDTFAGPKHIEIIEVCLGVPEHFYFIISVVSFYLAVRPRVAAREQFAMCPGMLLFF